MAEAGPSSQTSSDMFQAKSSLEPPKSVPRTSPHFIGYHPQKLYKLHGHLQNAEAIAFLPGQKVIAADKHTGHVVVVKGEGEDVEVIARSSHPCGIAVFEESGDFVIVDPKDKHHQIKVIQVTHYTVKITCITYIYQCTDR